MIKRIIEIGNPAFLHLRHEQMVIEREGQEVGTVPVEDMGVLILDHPAISYTQRLLSSCAQNNVAVLVCDERHLPAAVFMPLDGNTLHSKTIARQSQITVPTRKRLWQTIVKAKIRQQATVLHKVGGDGQILTAFASRVKSGDPENVEAQAARIYWPRMFGPRFRRDHEAGGVNSLLNYGYSVMRAAVARAIVGTGLHPAIGIHHHNQYNSFCLADDLVEPLRPMVDLAVQGICTSSSDEPGLTKENKRTLLEVLGHACTVGNQRLPVMVALHHYAADVRKAVCGEGMKVEIPEL